MGGHAAAVERAGKTDLQRIKDLQSVYRFKIIAEDLQKDKIFKDMKTAYDLRGQIMHGSKQVYKPKLEAIIPETEEYLRQSIRRFLALLSQGISLNEIRKKLDDNILKNGKILNIKE